MAFANLAKALSGGAVKLVTGLIRAATTGFNIFRQIGQHFPGLSSQEKSQIYWEGWEAWNAAQDTLSAPPTIGPPISEIPENPFLGMGELAPDRFRYTVHAEYQLPGESFTRQADLTFTSANEVTEAALADQYQAWLAQLRIGSPSKKWGITTEGAVSVSFQLIGVERRY